LPKQDIIKHFRHKTSGEHWEPETREHLEMKVAVEHAAKLLGWEARLEECIKQHFIADVLLLKNGNRIAVECQCASLSLDQFYIKDSFYQMYGLYPLWVFGGGFFKHTKQRIKWRRLHKKHIRDEWVSVGYKEYLIQKSRKIERVFLEKLQRDLFYFDNKTFFRGRFQKRWGKTKTLGWYKLQECKLDDIIESVCLNVFHYVECFGFPSIYRDSIPFQDLRKAEFNA